VRRSLREIWRRRMKMMMPVMKMERIMRFNDKAPRMRIRYLKEKVNTV